MLKDIDIHINAVPEVEQVEESVRQTLFAMRRLVVAGLVKAARAEGYELSVINDPGNGVAIKASFKNPAKIEDIIDEALAADDCAIGIFRRRKTIEADNSTKEFIVERIGSFDLLWEQNPEDAFSNWTGNRHIEGSMDIMTALQERAMEDFKKALKSVTYWFGS